MLSEHVSCQTFASILSTKLARVLVSDVLAGKPEQFSCQTMVSNVLGESQLAILVPLIMIIVFNGPYENHSQVDIHEHAKFQTPQIANGIANFFLTYQTGTFRTGARHGHPSAINANFDVSRNRRTN